MELTTTPLEARKQDVTPEPSAVSQEDYERFVSVNYRWNFAGVLVESSLYSFVSSLLSVYTVLAYYVGQLTDSRVLVGLVPAISIGGFFLPQLITAKALQSKPRTRPYLITGAALQRLGILGLLILASVQPVIVPQVTLVLFFLIFTFYSAASGIYYPAFGDFVGKAIPRRKGMLLGTSHFVGGLLSLLGASLLTYLFARLDYPRDTQYAFGIAFLASLISLAVIVKWREPPGPTKSEVASWSSFFASISLLLRHHANFRKYLLWRAAMTVGGMALPFYLVYVMGRFDLSASHVGVFTLLVAISQVIMNPIWGWIGDRRGHLNVIVLASLFGAVGAILAAVGQSAVLFYPVFWGTGAMLSGFQMAGLNILYEFDSSQEPSTLIAISATVLSPLSALVPIVGGVLASSMGYVPVFWIAATVQAISTFGLAIAVKNPALTGRQKNKGAAGTP